MTPCKEFCSPIKAKTGLISESKSHTNMPQKPYLLLGLILKTTAFPHPLPGPALYEISPNFSDSSHSALPIPK